MRLSEAIEQLKYYQSKPYVLTVKKVCNIALETIEALQQGNEQLKAQVARMREALECVESDFVDGVGIVACAFCGKENAKERGHHEFCVVGKDLTSIDTTDYHNPADVEALRKAREALDYWRELYGTGLEVLNWHMNGDTETFDSFYDNSGTYEALAEIDKAIGGKEDV